MPRLSPPAGGALCLQNLRLNAALPHTGRRRKREGEKWKKKGEGVSFWRPANHDEKPLQN